MKLSKNKKIILLITGLGILTTSIVTPIVVINNKNNNQEKENEKDFINPIIKKNSEDLNKVNEIIAKIKDKDILIPANVSTQIQSEIHNAIKDQLKKENQTLNEDDLSKITINNIETLTLGNQIKVTLTIKINSTIEKLTINVEKINLLKNSNIDYDWNGIIFQDLFGNLWAMGNGTPLQVLEVNSNGDGYVNEGWTNDTTKKLLNSSNIINGFDGTLFQDKFKNLWAMGNNLLQVLKANDSKDGYVTTGWTEDITQELLRGSNFLTSNNGTIFQDSFGNLWAMASTRNLQVLKVNSNADGYVPTGWTNDTTKKLLNGSNINNGYDGKIFQDSFKNLWAMGNGTKLQVLKANDSKNGYVTNGWTEDITQGLLKDSNIDDGQGGMIFQDSFKNLWSMGYDKKLQVLKANNSKDDYVSQGWTDDNNISGLLNGSNITNGEYGTICQDSFGNLWSMGYDKKLQVLKVNSNGDGYVSTGWTDVNNTLGLLNDSNIIDGLAGTIFQDKFKNLWAMGNGTKLQVLKVNSNGDGYVSNWTDDKDAEGLLNGSNIIDGLSGTIFQDKFKNLWVMSHLKKLQVLIANSDNSGYINSWL